MSFNSRGFISRDSATSGPREFLDLSVFSSKMIEFFSVSPCLRVEESALRTHNPVDAGHKDRYVKRRNSCCGEQIEISSPCLRAPVLKRLTPGPDTGHRRCGWSGRSSRFAVRSVRLQANPAWAYTSFPSTAVPGNIARAAVRYTSNCRPCSGAGLPVLSSRTVIPPSRRRTRQSNVPRRII